ncbi:MAG: glutamine--tRNA ligase, partial [Clostridia bacterium]|nr:glutamine--tRNA ligase [Clostridia bacterium]
PNLNMRDPVIYRISHNAHHNTGDKWCVYPMYDYAHPLEDAFENITHSVCTLEFEDHRPLYDWVLRELEFKTPPKQIEFARLNLTNTMMSKRYLKNLVDERAVDGWDDPRMPTIAGLRRRGYTPEAIRDFCDRIGVAKSNSTVDIALLEHCIREDLKLKIETKIVILDPLKVVITNYPEDETEWLEIENNKEVESMGKRKVPFSRELYIERSDFLENPPKKFFRMFPGNEVRFKGAYFIKCEKVIKDENGEVIELRCIYDPETKSGSGFTGRKVKGTIHWLDAKHAKNITVRAYEHLMLEDEEENLSLNPDSLETFDNALAEPSIEDIKAGERYQFFRHGYFYVDPKLIKEDDNVFNRIVALKSSYKK